MIPRSGVAAVAAVLSLLLTGCSDSDEAPGEGGADQGASDPSSTPSAPSEPSASSTETDATPAVAPAAGELLKVDDLRLRAPLSYSGVPDQFTLRQAVYVPWTETNVSVFRFPNLAGYTVDGSAESTLRDGSFARGRRLDDLVIDDQPVFHLVGRLDRGGYGEMFGTVLGDNELRVTFEFHDGEPAAHRDDVIASVLETVDFGAKSVTPPAAGSVPPPPARGTRIEIPEASLRVPTYWGETSLPGPTYDAAFLTTPESAIVLSAEPRGGVSDLEQLGDASVRAPGWRTPATRLEDTEIAGQPAVHVAGRVAPDLHVERFAMLLGRQRLIVSFEFSDGAVPAYRDEVVASVLQTVRLAG